ncbi:LysR substrate-binding domain-containing protein [Tenacibaculum jejuense]|uniref:Transcriptional regulator, LysR family n=1 Tax=Tenacibaculum jejuense TaxID=584609 RepID=A0A238U9F5_9FLAO|nr:LysR substrate-binding domain-containing protein [Tenacibaculum jejuense]SNR15807.1 Transcriptional regulator, LysR family [Tenacibaculum jejuense]
MNYTLHQLKVFLEIVDKKSITKAAESLFLTQPAVSIQLKNFQEQFPIPLTEVVGKKLYITDFGQEIADTAKQILIEVETINHKTYAYQGKLAGQLKLAVVSTGKYVMPYYVSDFLKQHESIDFSMDVTNKQSVVTNLENNEVDFALVSVLPSHLNLETIPLLRNSLYLVGSSTMINEKKKKKSKIFTEGPLIYREKGSATRNAMEMFVEKKNFQSAKKIELTSNEALKQAVIAGIGYSIMPLIGIKSALMNKEISIIPYKGLPIETEWNLVWRKEKKLTPIAKAFVDYVRLNKNTIRNKHFSWIDESI